MPCTHEPTLQFKVLKTFVMPFQFFDHRFNWLTLSLPLFPCSFRDWAFWGFYCSGPRVCPVPPVCVPSRPCVCFPPKLTGGNCLSCADRCVPSRLAQPHLLAFRLTENLCFQIGRLITNENKYDLSIFSSLSDKVYFLNNGSVFPIFTSAQNSSRHCTDFPCRP